MSSLLATGIAIGAAAGAFVHYWTFRNLIGPHHEERWVQAPPLTRQLQGAQDAVAAAFQSPTIADPSVVPVEAVVASTPAATSFWFSSEFASFLLVLAVLFVLRQMLNWCRAGGPGPVRHLFGILDDDNLAGPATGPGEPAPDDSTGHDDDDNGNPSQGQEEDQSSTTRKETLRLRWVRIQDRLLKRDRRQYAIRELHSQNVEARYDNALLKVQLETASSNIDQKASVNRKQAEELKEVKNLLAEALDKNQKLEADVVAANNRTDAVQAALETKDKECHQHLTAANERTAEVQGHLDEEKKKSRKLSDDLDTARRAEPRDEVLDRAWKTIEVLEEKVKDLEEENGITAGFAAGEASNNEEVRDLTEKLASSERRAEEQAETIDQLKEKLAIKEKNEKENAECIEGLIAELFNAQNDVRECEESCAEGRSASGKVTRELTLQLGVTRYCLEGSKAQVASLEARLARCRCGQSKTTLDDGSDGDASEGNDWNDVEDEEDKNDDAGNGGNSGDDQDDDSDDAPAPDGAAIFDPSSTEDKDQPETSTANIDNAAQPQASVEDEVLASTPPASPLAASPTDSASSLGSLFASSSVSPRVSSPVSGSGPEGQAGVESATDPTGDIDPGTSSNGAGESVTGGSAYAPDAVPTRNWALVFGPTYAAEPEVKDEDEDEDDNDKTSALSTVPAANEPTISSPAESFVVVSPPESSPIATPEGQWNSLPVTPLALPSPLELDYSPECPPNSASASGVNANTPKRRTASGRAFKATKGHSDKTGGSASKTQKRSRELALRLNAQARLLHQGPTSPVTPEEVECLTSSMASFSIQDPDQDGPGDALMLEPPVEEDSEMSDADPPADEDSAMDDAEPPVKEDSDMEDADQDGPGSAYPPENVEMADVDERPSHHAPVFRDPNPFRGVMDLRTLPPCYHLPHDQEMTDIPSGMEEGDAGQPMDLGPDAATGAGIGPVSAFDLGSRQLPPKQKAKEETDIEDNDEGPDPRDPVAEMTARMNAAAQGARLAGERRETERLNQVLADADMGDAPLTPAEYRMLAAQAMRPRDEPEAQEQDQDTEGEGDSDNDMDADTDEDTTDSELDPDSEAAEAEYVAWRARALRAQRPPSPNRGGIGRRDEPEPELTANCDDDCPWECDENGFPIQDGFHGPKPKQKK